MNPAYHYSFAIRDEFRRLGWRADIYKPWAFPQQLLFADDAIEEEKLRISGAGEKLGFMERTFQTLRRVRFFVRVISNYKYFVVYGDAEAFVVFRSLPWRLVRRAPLFFSPELFLLKLLGKRVLFFPNGCHQEVLKRDFALHENGRMCANCILPESACNDVENQRIFRIVNKYHDAVIANTPMPSRSLPQKTQMRFLGLDLERQFRPKLPLAPHQRLAASGKLRILHSFVDRGRSLGQKNVKGSPYVLAAVERLQKEGHPVEYLYFNDIPSREMRFYQVQADIVVDQLLYGWWGSTAIECMGLGKPVVCYLTPSLKQEFLRAFPEYPSLPIVEATTETIYAVLKELVENPELRVSKGRESRQFAEQHFDVVKNARSFAALLESL